MNIGANALQMPPRVVHAKPPGPKFQPRDFPQSGSKAKDGEIKKKKRKKQERLKVGNNNCQLHIANATLCQNLHLLFKNIISQPLHVSTESVSFLADISWILKIR